MKFKDISNIRLMKQHVTGFKYNTPEEIVGAMCAMQAQDHYMAKMAIGLRLHGATNEAIQARLDDGRILRTHVLRPTWHFVLPEDIYWMLELTAPRIMAIVRNRDKTLGIEEKIYTKTNDLICKALEGGKHLTKEKLVAKLEEAGIATGDNKAAHYLMRAELDGLICSGKMKGNKQTYALLSKRAKKAKKYDKEEALGILARKYFSSRGPATLQDFIWWSGLTTKEAGIGLELIKHDFSSKQIDGQTYWLADHLVNHEPEKTGVHILPAFDEFIISYRDRTPSLPFAEHGKAVSNNGIFRPIIIINGQVSGIWRRTSKKDYIIIETELFREISKKEENLLKSKFESLEKYLNQKVIMK